MKRRTLLQGFATISVLPLISACLRGKENIQVSNTIMVESLNKPPETWRELLSPMAYKVLFEEDTERPGTSALNNEHREGTQSMRHGTHMKRFIRYQRKAAAQVGKALRKNDITKPSF